nr:MAG TPA: hypothetical protein [Caudoviricetes sp.]
MNIVEKYLSEHFRFHIPDSFSVPRWHRNYWDFNAAQLSEVTSDWSVVPCSTQPLSSSMCGEFVLRGGIARSPHLGTPNWSDGVIPAFAFTLH